MLFDLTEEIINELYHQSYEKTDDNENEKGSANAKKFDYRKYFHSQEEIAQIIRSDNIDNFHKNILSTEYFDLNSKIESPFFENNPEFNNCDKKPSLLDYAMAFDAINIFHYLLMNKVDYSSNYLKYLILILIWKIIFDFVYCISIVIPNYYRFAI
ncbi:hypothetical protein TRFO_17136 [Tritrichomonas foetus]|uniref:DUF3447 domain-containing protein n=1 Tax=Tritrichomonas foetus TaxID=1144522 RepID=A0A1J4KP36_9EUKA|nr:hypothetical protein TRFO_17136 [Tritrichomonas foetus]|eukprot:OHT12874.1 hypothetical protein TRFO_17136 [Tritrichomonas foetus]